MRLGVVSDIHGNLPALLAVAVDAESRGGVDGWLNLGDILSGPLWPAETADWLMRRGWATMAGNHERQLLAQVPNQMSASDRHAAERLTPAHRAWLTDLPAQLRPAAGVLCVHGTPSSDLKYLLQTVNAAGQRDATPEEVARRLGDPAAALVLCGHSHLQRQMTVTLPAGPVQVMNPGSVGLPAFDDDHGRPHVNEAGSPHARYALIEDDGNGWQVQLRLVVYDWEAAATQAELNGRGDWADALRTGRVGRTERDIGA
ncbi:MAG: metallophosphoesterase family protein [Rubrivivax sp.]|nr:metallophosphoesterase family protein [Rubrivivax sp.]